MGAGATAIGGIVGAYGDTKGRKQARRNLKYQKEQVDRGLGLAEEQLATLFGEGGVVPEKFAGAREDIQTGTGNAISTIQQGFSEAGDIAREGIGGAISRLDPYAQQGAEAFTTFNQALQGGQGAADALSQFQESTGYGFLQDEMQRATQRQFGAQGKGGSGNVLAALQERSAGIASQSFNDFMGNLLSSSQIGAQATSQQSTMEAGMGELLAGLKTGESGVVAGMQQGMGTQLANLGVSEASLESQVRQGAMQGGFGFANQALAGTLQAGSERAQYEQAPYHTLGATIAASGNQASASSQLMGGGGEGGGNMQGIMQMIPAVMSMFSDERLKDNIEQIGEVGGLGVYSFDPTEEGKNLGMDYTIGFLAQEVQELYPDYVHEVDGYLAVNYKDLIPVLEGGM